MKQEYDVAVVGAGAAGLMAAIQAARQGAGRVAALDGAKHLGAKILVAGGGRCNVTHHEVDETAFAGSRPKAIRNVLRRFDVARTVEFFSELGVELKREDTGKLFPVTDRARTVLDALLRAAGQAGVEIRHPYRVERVERSAAGFIVHPRDGDRSLLSARRVILATGGKSLPKSGSDGAGYGIAESLGHTLTARIFPALVPLLLPDTHPLTALSGISFVGELRVESPRGKKLAAFTGPVLCTHFGLSGPTALDISRYFLNAQQDDPDHALVLDALPEHTRASLDDLLRGLGARPVAQFLKLNLPERLAHTWLTLAGVPSDRTGATLTREERRRLLAALKATVLPVTGNRGYRFAEVTAGGVPLAELKLETLESRRTPGLHLCGEICDVDGRIGGFNFQWAWASGYVAGSAAAAE